MTGGKILRVNVVGKNRIEKEVMQKVQFESTRLDPELSGNQGKHISIVLGIKTTQNVRRERPSEESIEGSST